MQIQGMLSPYGLEHHGLENVGRAFFNLEPAHLIEQIISRSEGELSDRGEVYIFTGKHTGRSPKAKYIVDNEAVKGSPMWWEANNRMTPGDFVRLYDRVTEYLSSRDVYVQDVFTCSDPEYQYSLRIISETAWGALFASNLFIRRKSKKEIAGEPEITVIHCPNFHPDPTRDGTEFDVVVALDFEKRIVLIGGTGYAGELKKSVFTMLNFLLPARQVLPMHCSANEDKNKNTALFFGLSGTGKTTLSNDKAFKLIGDDEHGWSNAGVFNFEGGCYAKTIRLSKKHEPMIWNATRRFGTILENVTYDKTSRTPDFDSASYTENTRAAYSLQGLGFVKHNEAGTAPKNIFFLSADAFGVLPPLARLTEEQIQFYFLLGYTAKLAGTEVGLGKEPCTTFSACFAAPFLPLHPRIYTQMLLNKVRQHGTAVWLVNTGWTGGAYGTGKRIPIPFSRALIRGVLVGKIDETKFRIDPIFGLHIPLSCPDVPDEILDPRSTWNDPAAYDSQAKKLWKAFKDTYTQRAAS